ncbi:MAG: hypothetical protein DRI97_09500 [Bacteroidetes bacterium]|nr:MAG: hypothetical protein DRI97_09500 [Bacteroidota bacterium]
MADKKNINRFISSPIAQTFLVYISGGWIVLEMTDYFINYYSLTERFRDILLIVLIICLPLALFLTWYFSRDKETKDEKDNRLSRILWKRPWFSIPAIMVVVLVLFTAVRFVYRHNEGDSSRLPDYSNIKDAIDRAEVSLAVLPFTNFSGNSDQDWLISGQHEALIHELSKISQFRPFRIISRSTVDAFKNREKPVSEIAREINVEYLVEASVVASADSVSIQLRLIRVNPEESVVWAESAITDFTHILKFYSDLAEQIAEKVDLGLTPDETERLSNSREVNPESYKAYLRGMYHLNLLTPEGLEKGLEYLHQAVSLDPAEPFAYAGLALGYLEIAHGPLDPGDALTKAEAAASQAFKLDSTMAEVYAALAEVYLYDVWEFDLAEEYFLKALDLNPNLAIVHYHYAWALYLFGQLDEAIVEHKLAQKYDPFNPLHTSWLGTLYSAKGLHEEAIEAALESLDMRGDYSSGYFVLGMSYLFSGQEEKAIEAHTKLMELHPWWSWALGYTYATTGHIEEAEEILQQLENGNINGWVAHGLMTINAALDRMDEAYKWLNYEPHHAFAAWAAVMDEYQTLRKDPRFEDFLARLNLPD